MRACFLDRFPNEHQNQRDTDDSDPTMTRNRTLAVLCGGKSNRNIARGAHQKFV